MTPAGVCLHFKKNEDIFPSITHPKYMFFIFSSITKCYYRNSVGALLVYDVCNRTSFENIPLWMAEAKNHIEPHRPVFALVGCKLDLVKTGTPRQVSEEEVREFAMQYDLFHIETSAKTGYNAEKAFAVVAQEVSVFSSMELNFICRRKYGRLKTFDISFTESF